MRDFRFILGRRALIVFLALLIATGALLGMPAATRTLAGTGDGWRDLNPLTPSPTARTYHAMATLPGGNVLLFGGLGDSGRRNDTWLFNTANNAWGLLDTGSASPSKRLGHAMAKTSSGVLLFGGFDSSLFNDTWLFNASTSTWGLLDTGSASPTKRFLHAMATLPTGDVLLFGGWDSGGTFRNDTWLFNASTSTWGLLDTGSASPSARNAHAMAKTSSGVLLFGGNDGTINLLNDTWLFTYDNTTGTGTWTKLQDAGGQSANRPPRSGGHAMAALPGGDVLLFGGNDGTINLLNDTWLFTYDNTTGTGTWTKLSTTTPSARWQHAMAATPSGALLFGGLGANPTVQGGYLNNGDSVPLGDTWLYGPITLAPSLAVTSPTAGAHWEIGSPRDITWTSTDLNSTTLTILLARDGVHFTETLTCGVDAGSTSWTWTVTGPGTINAKIRVQQDATEGTSGFFTIADAYSYTGTPITTSDPVLEISGGTDTGTLWVTPLKPSLTIDPDLNQFLQQTGQRAALFFDIGQQGLNGTLTIILHFNHQLGEETFALYLWNSRTGWVEMGGTPNLADHTFTFTIDAKELDGTPFALGGNPTAMPGLSPWGLALLSLALLSLGGWWFLRRRRLA